jgi:hypothetical protein
MALSGLAREILYPIRGQFQSVIGASVFCDFAAACCDFATHQPG